MQWILVGLLAASSVVPSLSLEEKGAVKVDVETAFLSNTRVE